MKKPADSEITDIEESIESIEAFQRSLIDFDQGQSPEEYFSKLSDSTYRLKMLSDIIEDEERDYVKIAKKINNGDYNYILNSLDTPHS